jgi:hypothetical protein
MRSRALIALTITLPVEYPAELAADCMQLFSRIERLELRRPMRLRTAPRVKERTQAVIATPRPQPVLRPTKRFDRLITAPSKHPIRTALVVS